MFIVYFNYFLLGIFWKNPDWTYNEQNKNIKTYQKHNFYLYTNSQREQMNKPKKSLDEIIYFEVSNNTISNNTILENNHFYKNSNNI